MTEKTKQRDEIARKKSKNCQSYLKNKKRPSKALLREMLLEIKLHRRFVPISLKHAKWIILEDSNG